MEEAEAETEDVKTPHVSEPVPHQGKKYYMEFDNLLYPGVPDLPEYVVSATLDGNVIIQNTLGCDWDDETDNVTGHIEYGANGEDFITFEMKKWTWIAINPKAEAITKEWNANNDRKKFWRDFLLTDCPTILKLFVRYGKTYLSRKVLPSVFLLQKTPSSPVTCLSTDFFPEKASSFWRKDGEEIHEGVEHGDILPNDDGSFQMSVDLEVLSIPPEVWGRYECVFELSGVQNYVVTKLDQDTIRSNNAKSPLTTTSIAVIATMGCVIVIIVVALASISFKKIHLAHRTERSSTPSSDIALDTTPDTGWDTASNTGSL
ncbi:major histocompatibility complex class I-related gene protein-like [Fundulus heteroclitus]|uniref:major histocompatibility complex class I-related gene protein-like n=1 Tax=Fundulus heteroclitus TaxID=8078 RepID=UPI00165AA52E|nr:major histocompatibility complex class I-related gene protein-like [Fundulus heteroclitus]